jgi:hypothetical protein
MYGGWCEVGKAGSGFAEKTYGLERDEKVDYSGVCARITHLLFKSDKIRLDYMQIMIHYSKAMW